MTVRLALLSAQIDEWRRNGEPAAASGTPVHERWVMRLLLEARTAFFSTTAVRSSLSFALAYMRFLRYSSVSLYPLSLSCSYRKASNWYVRRYAFVCASLFNWPTIRRVQRGREGEIEREREGGGEGRRRLAEIAARATFAFSLSAALVFEAKLNQEWIIAFSK